MATTPITPLKAPALADLKNALQLAGIYGDKDIADSDAKQALQRIRALIATALAKLAEPNQAAVVAVQTFVTLEQREARDFAATILRVALTGDWDPNGWVPSLPCPICDGAAVIRGFPCESCKGTGLSQ